jgi:hypothetical protein
MGAVAPDVEQIRNAFSQNLMKQRNEAMRGVQDVYAGRGTTGSGEEAFGLGQTGYNFGVGMGQGEAQLQQYLGNLGQQQYQFDTTLGEGQRQFDVGQGNWQQQFGEGQRQFNVGAGFQEAGMRGYFGQNPQDMTLGGREWAATSGEKGLQEQYAKDLGFGHSFEMSLAKPEELQERRNLANVQVGGQVNFDLLGLAGTPFEPGKVYEVGGRKLVKVSPVSNMARVVG